VAELVTGLDGPAIVSVLVKAGAYLTSLLAAGSVLFALLVAREGWLRRVSARLALAAVAMALVLTAVQVGMSSSKRCAVPSTAKQTSPALNDTPPTLTLGIQDGMKRQKPSAGPRFPRRRLFA